jgi:hydroxymethylpyrimidine pyrophosphatase-like HAD family hydrolase
MDLRPKTIICDIDGTLVEHGSPSQVATSTYKMTLLPGTLTKLEEWEAKGYRIILLTGRKESMREVTKAQLKEVGIFYDQLIMGVGGGARYLINDNKPNGAEYATAINVERNKGVKDINI